MKTEKGKKEGFLSLDDSKCLYGLAILMMLFHHLFCIPERLGCNYIPMFGEAWGNIEIRIAWVCKMCVGIYAFITGFGMCRVIPRVGADSRAGVLENLKTGYKKMFSQISSFYRKYWLVFLIFVPVRFVIVDRNFDIIVFIKNFLGISSDYNGEWWYIRQYVGMLLIFPIFDGIVNWILLKKKMHRPLTVISITICALYTGVYFVRREIALQIIEKIEQIPGITYLTIFTIGYFISRFDIFDRIVKKIKSDRMQMYTGIAGIGFSLVFRYMLTPYASWARGDVFFVPALVFFVGLLNHSVCKNLLRGLRYLGRYSIYMWLTHTFYTYYYFQKIVLLPRYSLLIYLWLIILSLITAIVLERIKNWIDMAAGKKIKSRY